ncbi:MAG TPA: adenylate/guanylate cyclase domain-containing protein [Actinomycetota bacterium]|nr:adenylate/guanylate cyclase domain-containing protein [Actinomycetota bacterium]
MTRSDLPSGTVTFLFTDIEGSTRLLHATGEEFPALLEKHHELLREAFAGGIEVATEGDAFFVVYTSAPAAMRGAIAAQRALASHDWGEHPVKVRMGLHTGEGVLGADNYVGIDVNRAARISSAAHGGQIVLSATAKTLVEGAVSDDVQFVDLGEHRLKDLDRPEPLFQVVADDLEKDFPPLRSLSVRPNNLPAQLSSFVGRPHEVTGIKECLEANRLVTLTGPGGTGKTRLALQVASDVLVDYADGAFVVLLAPVVDPELVPTTIATTLDIKDEGTTPVLEVLKAHLAGKEMLLILDNFEQVTPAAPVVTELLSAAPRLKMIVTSRSTLRVTGEQEYPVPPMALPDPDRIENAEQLLDYESVRLFIDRARLVKPDFMLTMANARPVAQICSRLDGLPLAIELAAARTRILSPDELFKRLEKCLTLLSTGGRERDARQQTLRGAIDWSYDLLEESEKQLFCRLSVFSGGCSFDAAEKVCDPDAELGIDVFEGLESLVDKSLIRQTESDTGQTRFRILQTIREYGQERFFSDPHADEIRRRHANFFLELAHEVEQRWFSSLEFLHGIVTDTDNLRGALRWCLDNGELGMGLDLGASVWRFWLFAGQMAEARQWLEELTEHPDARVYPRHLARAESALGSVTYWQNDFGETRRHYSRALEILRSLDEPQALAEAIYNLAFLEMVEQNFEAARVLHAEARARYQTLGDERGVANTAVGLGIADSLTGNYESAVSLAKEAHDYFDPRQDWFGMMMAGFVEYQSLRFQGRFQEAWDLMLDTYRRTFGGLDPSSISSLLESLADVGVEIGKAELAVTIAGTAARMKDDLGAVAPRSLVRVEDPRDRARAYLGEEEIERFYRDGYEMSSDEAVRYVLKEEGLEV